MSPCVPADKDSSRSAGVGTNPGARSCQRLMCEMIVADVVSGKMNLQHVRHSCNGDVRYRCLLKANHVCRHQAKCIALVGFVMQNLIYYSCAFSSTLSFA